MEAGIFWQAKLWREGATLTTRTALPTTSAVLRKDDCCKQPTSRWTALLCEGLSMPVVKVFQCLSSVADRSRGTTHPSWDLWEGIERGTRRGSFRNVGLARFSQLCDSWSPNSACADYQVQGHSMFSLLPKTKLSSKLGNPWNAYALSGLAGCTCCHFKQAVSS